MPKYLRPEEIVHIKEERRKTAPSKNEVYRVLSILRQFQIHIRKEDIPEFDNVQQLDFWRKQMIKEKLATV
jgi:hypothetical protein|nr:MAG TPA: hypothetical protein [Caudoviricetes sp.]